MVEILNFTNILNKVIGDPVYLQMYRHLITQPDGVTGQALATLIGVSPFKINQSLRRLESQGVITVTPVGRANVYRLQRDHVLTKEVILPLLKFEETLLSTLGDAIMQRLTPRPLSMIVFGSVARGEESAQSDIDLLLVYAKDQRPTNIRETFEHIVEYVTSIYSMPVTLQRCDVHALQQRVREKDPYVRKVIKEGRSIAGLSITEILAYGAHDEYDHRPETGIHGVSCEGPAVLCGHELQKPRGI